MSQSSVSVREAVSQRHEPQGLVCSPYSENAGPPGWLGLQHLQPGLLYAAWAGGPVSATCREVRGTGVPWVHLPCGSEGELGLPGEPS